MRGRVTNNRPWGRFSCVLLWLVLACSMGLASATLTTISDVVYRADGSFAKGTVVITWPAFTTSDSRAIAAGSLSVAIGAGGQLTVALVPNAGSTPSGTYYKVVYKLDQAVAEREIVGPGKFRDGLGQIIDGTVACLNASSWGKTK